MKEYELVVLFHPSLEVDMTAPLNKVAKIIKDAGGKVTAEDDQGRRRLAYKIGGEDFAIYRIYTLDLPADAPQKINDIINITDEVIRFLLTKVDPKAKALLAEEAARKKDRDDSEEVEEETEE